jgi:sterol desaturase/sphingolipid hydroxylase (fatty acid hydroxylase superfamily)
MLETNKKRKLFIVLLSGVGLLLFLILYNFEKVKEIWSAPSILSDFLVERFHEIFTNKFDWTFIWIYIAVTIGSFIIEMFFLGWEKSALKRLVSFRDKSSLNDLICWLLNIFNVFYLLAIVITLGLTYFFYGWVVHRFEDVHLISKIASPELQFAIIVLFGSLISYWKHRFYHSFPSWWEIHKYHHSATTFNMITHHRAHPLETAFNLVIEVFPFAIIGAPIESYLAFKLFQETHQLFIHSDVNWNWGWFGKYILLSPAAHRVHHSVKPEHYNKNMSTFIPIWDHLFGTWHDPEANVELGIESNPYNKSSFVKDMYIGYKRFVTRFLGLK